MHAVCRIHVRPNNISVRIDAKGTGPGRSRKIDGSIVFTSPKKTVGYVGCISVNAYDFARRIHVPGLREYTSGNIERVEDAFLDEVTMGVIHHIRVVSRDSFSSR